MFIRLESGHVIECDHAKALLLIEKEGASQVQPDDIAEEATEPAQEANSEEAAPKTPKAAKKSNKAAKTPKASKA